MGQKKQLGKLRALFRELAALLGNHRAWQVVLSLAREQPEDQKSLLSDIGKQIGEEPLCSLVSEIRLLLARLLSSLPDRPSLPGIGIAARASLGEPGVCRSASRPAKVRFHLRYFALDLKDRLRKAPRRLIEAAWDWADIWYPRRGPCHTVGGGRFVGCDLRRLTGGKALWLVTAMLERRGRLEAIYLLRVPLDKRGYILPGARHRCYQAQHDFRSMRMTPALKQMRGPEGWPADIKQQVAIILDLPYRQIQRAFRGFGGPLAIAAMHNLLIDEAVAMMGEYWLTAGKDS